MSADHNAEPDLEAIATRVEQIWKDVLQLQPGHEHETFFELNGESISANRLVSRIDGEFGIRIEVGDIFEDDPDLEGFVRTVLARATSATKV